MGVGVAAGAELRHVLHRSQTVADDIADRKVGPAVGQRHHAVPVPAHPVLVVRGLIKGAVLESCRLDRLAGLRHSMQHQRARVLVGVDLGANQGLAHHGAHRGDVGKLGLIEGLDLRPCQLQHAKGVPPGSQRPGDDRLGAGETKPVRPLRVGDGVGGRRPHFDRRAGSDDVDGQRVRRQIGSGADLVEQHSRVSRRRDPLQLPAIGADQTEAQRTGAGLVEHLILECVADIVWRQGVRQLKRQA